jgi:hypothetical protein
MNNKYPHLEGSFDFKRKHLAQYLPQVVGGFNIQNRNGAYHKSFKTNCPYDGKRRTVHFFYRHKHGFRPNDISSCPPCAFFVENQSQLVIIYPSLPTSSENGKQGTNDNFIDGGEQGRRGER